MTYEQIAAALMGDGEKEYLEGFLGGLDDNDNYAIEIAGERQMVYARTDSAQYEARNLGVPIAPDYPVRIYTNTYPPYVKPDETRLSDYIDETDESVSTVGPHSHEPGQGLFDFVSTRRLRELMVVVTNPPSMSIEVLPGKYINSVGEEIWFDGGTMDLTSYVPATAGTWCWCKIGIDDDGGLTATAGIPQAVGIDLTPSQLASILMTNVVSLGGVRLTNGMTAIDNERLFLDWRFIFQRVQSGIDTAIIKAPNVSAANKITSASDLVAFVVQAYSDGQVSYPLVVQTAAGDAALAVTSQGAILVNLDSKDAPSTFSGMTVPVLYVNPIKDNLSIGHTTPHDSAIVDIASTTKGVLLPRMTTSQRDAIASPAPGLFIYNTTTTQWNYYDGSTWVVVGAGGGGGGGSLNISTTTFQTRTVLYDNTLLSPGSWDVSSISQDYDYLEIELWLRTNTAANSDIVFVYFNNDTTASNYRSGVGLFGSNPSDAVADSARLAGAAGGSSLSDDYGYTRIIIPEYTGSKRKQAYALNSTRRSSTVIQAGAFAMNWESTAAINRIKIITDNDPTDQFVAGSRFVVVGVKESSVVTNVTGGLQGAAYSTANVSNPPTSAEITAAFDTPSAVGEGYVGIINDAGSGSNFWMCASDGASWLYTSMTKAL